MVDEDDSAPPPNIVSLDAGEWLERSELAERLGIGGERLDRCIRSDHIESKTTPEGIRYRYVGPSSEAEDKPESADSDGEKSTGDGDTVAVELGEWTEARESLARLESKLEASRRDVQRAVEYARELEQECDRLADVADRAQKQTTEVRSELDEERGRRRELQQQYEQVVERLEDLSGIRGRYHLERARREETDEKRREQAERIEELERQLEALTEALQKAREAGFTAELGALTVEWKR